MARFQVSVPSLPIRNQFCQSFPLNPVESEWKSMYNGGYNFAHHNFINNFIHTFISPGFLWHWWNPLHKNWYQIVSTKCQEPLEGFKGIDITAKLENIMIRFDLVTRLCLFENIFNLVTFLISRICWHKSSLILNDLWKLWHQPKSNLEQDLPANTCFFWTKIYPQSHLDFFDWTGIPTFSMQKSAEPRGGCVIRKTTVSP